MPELIHSFFYKNFCVMVLLALLASGCSPTTMPSQPTDISIPPTIEVPAELLASIGSGANIWIEFPYNGQTLPDEELTFVVYATSSSGVDSIRLALNGEPFPTTTLNDLSSDGSKSLASVEQTWKPTRKGQFTLSAEATGTSSSIIFCIETCETSGLELEPSKTPTPNITHTPTPTPKISPTVTATTYSAPHTFIELGADPYTINAGDCTTVYWNTDGLASVTLNSDPVYEDGGIEQCLCENTIYTLSGTDSIGGKKSKQITVIVNGSCDAEVDTEGPAISGWTFMRWEDCRFHGLATISDPSGVSSAKFYYNLNEGGWNSVWMRDLGDNAWESEVGVSVSDGMGTPVGSFFYYFEATDGNTNTSYSAQQSYSYNGCTGD
ncbi:MAG: hypothetical protein JEZ06_22825 [Anaerolineaceae bacterium]|nr:hypothetical protein [Anaerolineaceae bacterium]